MPDLIQTDLLREAAEWRLIGLLFESPSEDWHREVADLAAELSDDALRKAVELARDEALPSLYHSTFGPGGPASPREASYLDRSLPGGMISEVEGYYEAFDYVPTCGEPPDHVAVESGFVSYLRFKEAFALSRGEHDRAATTAEAARAFIAEHLARIADPLASSLQRSGIGYAALAADALRRRTGPSPDKSASASCLPVFDDDREIDGCEESA